jgi:hypothetical protein
VSTGRRPRPPRVLADTRASILSAVAGIAVLLAACGGGGSSAAEHRRPRAEQLIQRHVENSEDRDSQERLPVE